MNNADEDRPRGTWNYRLIHHNDGTPDQQWIGLHEVHYRSAADADNDIVTSWTMNAASFGCDVDEGPNGVVSSLEMALKDARDRPMLLMTMLKAQMKQHQENDDNDDETVVEKVIINNDDVPDTEVEREPSVMLLVSRLAREDERRTIADFVRNFSWIMPIMPPSDDDDLTSALCNQIADAILQIKRTED